MFLAVRQQCERLIRSAIELGKSTRERLEDVWDETNRAINERMQETKKAKNKLRSKLTQNNNEISDLQNIIEQLNSSLYSLDQPLKLASTRLAMRAGRHDVELCRDGAHLALVKVTKIQRWVVFTFSMKEIESIQESQFMIENKIQDAYAALQVGSF